MDLTDKEQAIVRGGLAAADLLANESFVSTIQSLMFECFAKFTESSTPAEREQLYAYYAGLKAIEEELNARVHNKDEIERQLNAAQEDHDELPF